MGDSWHTTFSGTIKDVLSRDFSGQTFRKLFEKIKTAIRFNNKRINKIREDRLKKNTFSSTSVSLPSLPQDIGSRIIEANIS